MCFQHSSKGIFMEDITTIYTDFYLDFIVHCLCYGMWPFSEIRRHMYYVENICIY